MEYIGDERRHLPQLTEEDVDKIASAVARKAREAFHIEDEKHYNDHQRLDRILTAYENATSVIWKTFIGFMIVGAFVLAGIGAAKGVK